MVEPFLQVEVVVALFFGSASGTLTNNVGGTISSSNNLHSTYYHWI